MLTRIVVLFSLVTVIVNAQSLFDAVRQGNIKEVKKVLKSHPDSLNTANSQGYTPLIIACYRNQNKIAKYLIKQKADVNSVSGNGAPLQAAAYTNNFELVKLLVANGARIGDRGPDGNNALAYAILNSNIEMTQFFLKMNADYCTPNLSATTPFQLGIDSESKGIQELFKNLKKCE